jgi:hypothetical protein
MPRSPLVWLLALIGLAAVLFLLFRFLLIPLLVLVGGGAG